MTNLLKAADDARRLLRGFKAFEEVANALDTAASLEQRVAEINAAIPGLTAQRDALTVEVAELQARAEKTKQEAKDIAASAKDAAAGILLDAKTKAEEVETGLKASREQVNANINEMVAAWDTQLTELTAKHEAATKEVKDLETRAEKAKAYLAKLAG